MKPIIRNLQKCSLIKYVQIELQFFVKIITVLYQMFLTFWTSWRNKMNAERQEMDGKTLYFYEKKNVLQDCKYLLPFLSTNIILWLLLWPGIKSWNIWCKYTVSHCQLVPWFWANKWTWAHSSKQTLAFSLKSTH